MKKTLLFIGLSISTLTLAQNTGVNTTTPKATLDIVANNTDGSTAEGLLIPRLTGDQIKAMTANLTIEQNGLMIFATEAVTTADSTTLNIKKPSTYRFDIASDGTSKNWVDMERGELEKFTATDNTAKKGWKLYNSNAKNISQFGVDLAFVPEQNNTDILLNIGNNGMNYANLLEQANYWKDNSGQVISNTSFSIPGNMTNDNAGIHSNAGIAFNAGLVNSIDGGSLSNITIGSGLFNVNEGYSFSNVNIGQQNINYASNQSIATSIGTFNFNHNSTIFGDENSAKNKSYVFGLQSQATGENSYAIGIRAYSLGSRSFVFGNQSIARNMYEVALGSYNFNSDNIPNSSPTSYTKDDKQLFSIGNGTEILSSRSNALIILRNAKTGIGLPTDETTPTNSKPTEMLDVNGNIRSRTISTNTGSVTDKVVVADANGVLKTGTSLAQVASKWTNDTTNSMVKLTNLSDGTTARTDDKNLFVKDNGNVGIGTNNPTAKLEVNNGTIKIVDGTQGEGKVLTSDANGQARWANVAQYTVRGTIPTARDAAAVSDATGAGAIMYTGCSITLPAGSWLIKSSTWLSAGGSNLITPSSANSSFASIFLSTSSTAHVPPTYISNIKSIIINPLYHGASLTTDFYGTGEIPITLTETKTIYLWGFVSRAAWTGLTGTPDITKAKVTSLNSDPGAYGPYTQLYAVPINYSN